MQENKPLISIVIPSYNGEEFIANTLDSITSQYDSSKVEIVICDDGSKDNTHEIIHKYQTKFSNICFFKNDSNLGMDGNFSKAASHARGEYIWFSGQDDIFDSGAISKVISVVETNPEIDFVYVNYGQYSHNLSKVITDKMLKIDNDVLCKDYKEFLSITGIAELPTFLPAFVLRRTLWEISDKEIFYGTQYVQVGVFLSLLSKLKLFIIAHPYIKGRIPDNGWQQNRLKLADIASGNLEVITYSCKKYDGLIPHKMYNDYYKKMRKWIIDELKECKLSDIKLNAKIKNRIKYLFGKRDQFLINLMFILPKKFTKSIFKKLIKLK